MKYLITGSTGFLGRNFIKKIDEDNNSIMKIDLRSLYYQDIESIKKFQPDYIINFAADIYNNEKMFKANVEDVQTLLEITEEIPYKKFIQIGSSSEYGEKKKPMSEDDILVPRTMYEATKGMATLLCQAHSKVNNKNIVVIRPFSVYGRYEKEHRFIPTLFKKFETKEEVTVSPGVHDFIHIDDFIEGLLKVAYFNETGFNIVNLGSGVQTTNLEVFEIFCRLFEYKVPLNQIKNKLREFDSDYWVANINKLERDYNFTLRYNLEEGLKQMYEEKYK